MKYVNQAPKEFKQQSAAFKKQHPDVDSLVRKGWMVQPKYDGVHVMIHTDGEGYARTRTGEEVLSVPHLIEAAKFIFGPGVVLFVEAYMYGTEHKVINGAVRRQYPQPDLIGMVYDWVLQSEFSEGNSVTPYYKRYTKLSQILGLTGTARLQCVPCVTLYGLTVNDAALNYQDNPKDAYDGLILRDLSAGWERGAAKAGEVIKVKPALTLDLKVVGQFAEQKPTKLGGHLLVEYNGVVSEVGSGLTQQQLGAILNGEADYTNSIAEVHCLGVFDSGKLREPRFKGFRTDTVREEDKE